jgi:hypothetical protein
MIMSKYKKQTYLLCESFTRQVLHSLLTNSFSDLFNNNFLFRVPIQYHSELKSLMQYVINLFVRIIDQNNIKCYATQCT